MNKQLSLFFSVNYQTLPEIHNALNKLLKWNCGQLKGSHSGSSHHRADGLHPSAPMTDSKPGHRGRNTAHQRTPR